MLDKRINELIFKDHDLSKLPPFRITTQIAVPNGQNAFEFFNEAMRYAGEVKLDDDDSWESFMRKIFDYIVGHMTPMSQLYSFLLVEGGESAIKHICFNYLPNTLHEEWANTILGSESKQKKFNTFYSQNDLEEISRIMNIQSVEGINFALSGKLT